MADYPTITRQQLVEAAEKTIAAARYRVDVSPEQEHCYLEIAKHVDLITPGWTAETSKGKCGCLVGSLRMKRGQNPIPYGEDPDKAVGLEFPDALEVVLSTRNLELIYRVIG